MKKLNAALSWLGQIVRQHKFLTAWAISSLVILLFMSLIGGLGGYRAAQLEREKSLAALGVESLSEQYSLAIQDLEGGRFDVARQRFEYILARDPAFPGAADGLARAIQILYASATPSPIPATVTPTPTQDMRPIQDLFTQAEQLFSAKEWNSLVDVVLAIRRVDEGFNPVVLDRFLYRALRNRGLEQITQYGNLEQGIYDITLSEAFGPIDEEALTYRDLARYYMMGSSFWEVFPEQAIYYFNLVASAMPSLRDSSGWTAAARLQAVLLQFADQLAREGAWCDAQAQYELAFSYSGDFSAESTADYAALQCSPPTETESPVTETPTPTFLLTASSTMPGTVSPTVPPLQTETPTSTNTLVATATPSSAPTSPATTTPTPQPSDTAAPTSPPNPTETATDTPPAPQPTEAPSPTSESLPTGVSP
jgi:hypothetical protein